MFSQIIFIKPERIYFEILKKKNSAIREKCSRFIFLDSKYKKFIMKNRVVRVPRKKKNKPLFLYLLVKIRGYCITSEEIRRKKLKPNSY